MQRGAPAAHFALLEERLQMPVVAFASSWRSDLAVDPDETAARVVIDFLEEAGFLDHPVALVMIGRGGELGFCDLIFRAARGVELHTIVPYLVTGRVGLAALAGSSVALGRYGAIGAYDAPGAHPSLRVEAHASRSFVGRLLSDVGDDADGLSTSRLGQGQGLLANELAQIGAQSRSLDGADDDAAWNLFAAYEQSLGLRGSPRHRYSESDVGDEVEWEFATGVPGAFVESASASSVFVLDTGRPDPDSGRLFGNWRVDDEEEPLELDFDNARPVEA